MTKLNASELAQELKKTNKQNKELLEKIKNLEDYIEHQKKDWLRINKNKNEYKLREEIVREELHKILMIQTKHILGKTFDDGYRMCQIDKEYENDE